MLKNKETKKYIKNNDYSNFEDENVKDIYNEISKHFDKTRYHSWPKIEEFSKCFEPNSVIADVGCGNGRNCLLREDCVYHGYDNCDSFVDICKKQGILCKKSNILDIQCETNKYNYVMCIAVIHHLSNKERRKNAIKELLRITKKNGKILIYVWAKEQEKFKDDNKKDVFVPWKLQKKYNNNTCDYKKDVIYYRYYHLFEKNELEQLIYEIDESIKIIESGFQKDNYYVILEK